MSFYLQDGPLYERQCLNSFIPDDWLEMFLHVSLARGSDLFGIPVFREHVTDLVKFLGGVVGLCHHQQIAGSLFVLVQGVFPIVVRFQYMGEACDLVQGLKTIDACQVDADRLVCGICRFAPGLVCAVRVSALASARWLSWIFLNRSSTSSAPSERL